MNKNTEILKRAKELLVTRISKLDEVSNWVDYIVVKDLRSYDPQLLLYKGLSKEFVISVLRESREFFKNNSVNNFEDFVNNTLMQKYSSKLGNVLYPIRVAISGKTIALPLYESMIILEEFYPGICFERISNAIRILSMMPENEQHPKEIQNVAGQ